MLADRSRFIDLSNQVALITGGTRGLGLAVGTALAQRGVRIVATYRWGSSDEADIEAAFRDVNGPPPRLVQADVANSDDTAAVLKIINDEFGRLDIFVSNVCLASRGGSVSALRKRDFLQSFSYSVWPTARYLSAIETKFGKPPRVTLAMSSDGPDHFYPGYDYVAAAKAGLETLVAQLAPGLAQQHARIFGLRTRHVATQSLADIFPPDIHALLTGQLSWFAVNPEDMGHTALALCSGWLDGLNGQVLTADKGAAFHDNFLAIKEFLGELAS